MNDTSYQGMALDEIIQLTDSDDRHAPELEEQADGAARLRNRVARALDAIDAAAARLTGSQWGAVGQALSGHSGNAALERVRELSELTDTARTAMEPQSDVMLHLADRVRTTHREVARLRTDRESWLRMLREDPRNPKLQDEFGGFPGLLGIDKEPGELEKSIRDRYDAEARTVMTDAGTAYLDDARRLAPIGAYSGPRIPRVEPGPRSFDREYGHRPGPTLEPRHGGPAEPGPDSPPSPGAEAIPVRDPGPELQTGAGGAPAPAAPPPPGPVGDVYVPGKPVLPPVIGSRQNPTVPHGPSSGPTRQPTGLSRPVIGARTTPSMPTTRPGATGIPNSTLGTTTGRPGPLPPGRRPASGRPATGVPGSAARTGGGGTGFRPAPTVPGIRSNTAATGVPDSMTGNSRSSTATGSASRAVAGRGPHARPAAGVPASMAGTTRTAARPGTGGRFDPSAPASGRRVTVTRADVVATSRARGQSHEPAGRVIGRRTPAPSGSGITPPRVTRTPRVVHGGNENLNRSVIGNMRSASPPPRDDRRHDEFDDFDWDEADPR